MGSIKAGDILRLLPKIQEDLIDKFFSVAMNFAQNKVDFEIFKKEVKTTFGLKDIVLDSGHSGSRYNYFSTYKDGVVTIHVPDEVKNNKLVFAILHELAHHQQFLKGFKPEQYWNLNWLNFREFLSNAEYVLQAVERPAFASTLAFELAHKNKSVKDVEDTCKKFAVKLRKVKDPIEVCKRLVKRWLDIDSFHESDTGIFVFIYALVLLSKEKFGEDDKTKELYRRAVSLLGLLKKKYRKIRAYANKIDSEFVGETYGGPIDEIGGYGWPII